MKHGRFLSLVVALLGLWMVGGGDGTLAAQQPDNQVEVRTRPALQLVEVQRTDQNRWRYHYEIAGVQPSGRWINEVRIDLRAPFQGSAQQPETQPEVLGTRGRFLWDALQRLWPGIPYTHPPVWIGTPGGWTASIWRQGLVAWLGDRGNSPVGVRPGQFQQGFILESPAVPGFRKFRAFPNRWLNLQNRGFGQGQTLFLYEGYVLGPGFPARDVDARYLNEQIKIACQRHMLSPCQRYQHIGQMLLQAHEREDRTSLIAWLEQLEQLLTQDQTSHETARFVLRQSLQAIRNASGS